MENNLIKKLSEFETKCDAVHFLYDSESARVEYREFFIYYFEDNFYFEEKERWHYPPVSTFDGALFYIDMIINSNTMIDNAKKSRVFNERADRKAKIQKLYDHGFSVGYNLAENFDAPDLSEDDLSDLCIQKERDIGEFLHNSEYYTDGVLSGIYHYIKKVKRKGSA
jgi:hypothetical protein